MPQHVANVDYVSLAIPPAGATDGEALADSRLQGLTLDHGARQGSVVIHPDFAYTYGCGGCVGFCLHVHTGAERFVIAGHVDRRSAVPQLCGILGENIPRESIVNFAVFGGYGTDDLVAKVTDAFSDVYCKKSTCVANMIAKCTRMAVSSCGTFYRHFDLPDDPDIVGFARNREMQMSFSHGGLLIRCIDKRHQRDNPA